MFENITKFFKKFNKKEEKTLANSKEAAKERLHLVLMQDRANVSADFLELVKQEIIDVIKKYIDIDESAIDVRLTNKENADGTNGAPALYANIPIVNIKNEARKIESKKEENEKSEKGQENKKNEEIKKEEQEETKKEKTNSSEENEEKESKEEKAKNKEESKEIKKNDTQKEKQTNKQENKEKTKKEETKDKVKSEK